MEDVISYFKVKRNLINLLLLAVLVAGLPLGISLVRQQQIFKSRASAANVEFLTEAQGGTNCVESRGGTKVAVCKDVKLRITSPFGGPTTIAASSRTTSVQSSSLQSLLPKDLVKKVYAQACSDSDCGAYWGPGASCSSNSGVDRGDGCYGGTTTPQCSDSDCGAYWGSGASCSSNSGVDRGDGCYGGTDSTPPPQVCTPGEYQGGCTGACGGCAANEGEKWIKQCRADGSGVDPRDNECDTNCAGPCRSTVVSPPPSTSPSPAAGGSATTCKGVMTWTAICQALVNAHYNRTCTNSPADLTAYNNSACPVGGTPSPTSNPTTNPTTTPTTNPGTIQGFKVVMPGNTRSSLIDGQIVSIDGGFPTTTNPYFFQNVTTGIHRVSVSVPAGYTVGYTLCQGSPRSSGSTTNDLWIACHNGTPISGSSATFTVSSGSTNDLWWHYISPVTTDKYKVGEPDSLGDPSTWLVFTGDSNGQKIVDWVLPREEQLGTKVVEAGFLGSDGTTQTARGQINFVGPNPTISGCSPSLDSTGAVIFDIAGAHFGSQTNSSRVSVNNSNATITSWSDTSVSARLTNSTGTNQQFDVKLDRDGASVTLPGSSCKLNVSQISLGSKLICRAPSQGAVNNVDVIIAENVTGATPSRETVSFDKDGIIQGLRTKLQVGHQYKIGVKVKSVGSLRKTSALFTAAAGTTIVPDMFLPVGDISPAGGDGLINAADIVTLIHQWGSGVSTGVRIADLNGDGLVNSVDFACQKLSAGILEDPEPVGVTPPPSPNPSLSVSPSASVSPSPSVSSSPSPSLSPSPST